MTVLLAGNAAATPVLATLAVILATLLYRRSWGNKTGGGRTARGGAAEKRH